jgi:WD40 repeat protein
MGFPAKAMEGLMAQAWLKRLFHVACSFFCLVSANHLPASGATSQEKVPDRSSKSDGSGTPSAPEASDQPIIDAALSILRDECVSCHRPGKSKGGLKLTTLEFLKAGAASGPVVVSGNPEESVLYTLLLKDADPHMPPRKQLAQAQIQALKSWIQNGLPWDASVMERPPPVQALALQPMPQSVVPVLALSFSPDGKNLAVARGGSIEIRDAEDPKLAVKSSFRAHQDSVLSLAWSPDSCTLGTGAYQRVRFWDPISGQLRSEFGSDLVGEVNAMVWSLDGTALWVGDSLPGRSAFVRRFGWPEGKLTGTWKAHDDSLFGLALSPDGKWLATAGADKLARRWNSENGELLSVYEGHTSHVLAVVWDPLNPRMATAGADRELKVWDRDSREQDAVLGDKRQVFSCLAWAKDGTRLAALTDRGNGSLFSAIQKHTGAQSSTAATVQKMESVDAVFQSIAFYPDGSRVVGGASDGRIFVWKASDGKLQPLEQK